MKPQIVLYLFLAQLMLLGSCAQIVAPTGGKKDETAPKPTRYYPANKTTHFNAPRVVITFDEFIVLNNASEQVVVSPPLEKKPMIERDGKRVVLDLQKQALKPNTTYTINFGNAIGDLHENNIVENLTYVFSTGDALDSFRVSGRCLRAFNNSPEKDYLVALYGLEGFGDSTIFNEHPQYFNRSKPDGSFLIDNIPLKPYRMVAFYDENKNLKYDKNEGIGFTTDTVNPGDTTVQTRILAAYTPDLYEKTRLIDTFSREKGKFVFVAFKPLPEPLVPSNKSTTTWLIPGRNNLDTFHVFAMASDTVLRAEYTDKDRVSALTLRTKKGSKKPVFVQNFRRITELNDTVTIFFSNPVMVSDTSRIVLKEDTVVIKPLFLKTTHKGSRLQLYYPWKESTRYSIVCADSTFTDYFGQYGRADKYNWVTKSLKDYSSLKLHITHSLPDQILVQFTDEKETGVYKEFVITSSSSLSLEYLIPGTYKIKFIRDSNKNGVWDNGDYPMGVLPESVYYYPEPVVLRAYWDLEQTIDLTDLIK